MTDHTPAQATGGTPGERDCSQCGHPMARRTDGRLWCAVGGWHGLYAVPPAESHIEPAPTFAGLVRLCMETPVDTRARARERQRRLKVAS